MFTHSAVGSTQGVKGHDMIPLYPRAIKTDPSEGTEKTHSSHVWVGS